MGELVHLWRSLRFDAAFDNFVEPAFDAFETFVGHDCSEHALMGAAHHDGQVLATDRKIIEHRVARLLRFDELALSSGHGNAFQTAAEPEKDPAQRLGVVATPTYETPTERHQTTNSLQRLGRSSRLQKCTIDGELGRL